LFSIPYATDVSSDLAINLDEYIFGDDW
jgi:hypothetical protein